MTQRIPVTWSNTHQKRLDEILQNALESGQLVLSEGYCFRFLPDFFNTQAGAYVRETMPKYFLDAKVAEWLKKREN